MTIFVRFYRSAVATLLLALPAPVLAAGGSGAQPPGQPASRLQVAMTLYAGGITMGKMDMDATLRGSDYRIVSNLSTQGVVNAFWQSEIQATATGRIGSKTLSPALYDSYYTGSGEKKQQVSLSYDDAGAPRLFADPVYPVTGFAVKPGDIKDSIDPLSAVLFIASGVGAVAGNPCALTAPVFDGRRRYNIEMTKLRDVDVKMDNGLYQGKAVQCQIRYRQVAGFRPRLLKTGDSFPVINAWIVTLPSTVAGRDYTVPVRVWAETKYGVMAVVADSMTLDGAAIRAR